MTEEVQTVPLTSVSDLVAPGELLPFPVYDGQGRTLLGQGQRLVGAQQLAMLHERGGCVAFADVKALRLARDKRDAAEASATPKVALDAHRMTWFDSWEKHIWDLDAAVRRLGSDSAEGSPFSETIDQQLALASSQPDAALFSLVRQDDKRFVIYALSHARNTALVVQLSAQVLGWSAERVRCAVSVALSMNASIVELQARLAEQADPPTKKQMEEIHAHPTRSADMLRASGVTDADWLAGVEEHHEQPGGGGYPHAIDAPGELAHLVRAADMFAAKISPRAIRAALPPQTAARQLWLEEKGGPVAAALIKAVGLYPPGDLVTLKNGDAGVVVRQLQAGVEVAVLLSNAGKSLGGSLRRDSSKAEFAIAGPWLERKSLSRLMPEQLYGLIYP